MVPLELAHALVDVQLQTKAIEQAMSHVLEQPRRVARRVNRIVLSVAEAEEIDRVVAHVNFRMRAQHPAEQRRARSHRRGQEDES
jgi:hypothetical protein